MTRAPWPAPGAEIAAFEQRILSRARAHPLARRPISLSRHRRFDRRLVDQRRTRLLPVNQSLTNRR
jgi:hypothetical protein